MDPFFALLKSREEKEAPFPQADHLKHTTLAPGAYYPSPTLSAVSGAKAVLKRLELT